MEFRSRFLELESLDLRSVILTNNGGGCGVETARLAKPDHLQWFEQKRCTILCSAQSPYGWDCEPLTAIST
jgi:hypothetical protein